MKPAKKTNQEQPGQGNQGNQEQLEQRRVSFSELKVWNECPYKHKLIYIDKEPHFTGNEYTAFGTAMHSLCEGLVVHEPQLFDHLFDNNLEELGSYDDTLVLSMREAAVNIEPLILPALKELFGSYEVVSVEEKLFQPMDDIDSFGKSFKGYIDLVLKTEDGKYHILDWKTCSWGWNARKKSDKMINYQLMLYKKYFSLKHGIDPSKIETYFGLLKRTATKENVEIFRVSSGEKRVNSAQLLLERALKNINKGVSYKNKLSCKYCFFDERCNGART